MSYSISLNSLDDNSTNILLEAISFKETGNVIILEAISLPFRRLWNIRVFAHGCNQHPLTEEMELGIFIVRCTVQVSLLSGFSFISGTHDFYSISVTSPPTSFGVVMVTGVIVPRSTSTGILIVVYSLTEDNEVVYHIAQHNNEQYHQTHTMTMGLPAGKYQVVVFVMEEGGRPFCRAAATPRTVHIDGNYE